MATAVVSSGTLTIRVGQCELFRDTEWIGKMNPYCWIKFGEQSKRTSTMSDAGKFPIFNEELVFDVTSGMANENVLIRIYNENVLKDDIVGECNL